jgi:hypothetical protein
MYAKPDMSPLYRCIAAHGHAVAEGVISYAVACQQLLRCGWVNVRVCWRNSQQQYSQEQQVLHQCFHLLLLVRLVAACFYHHATFHVKKQADLADDMSLPAPLLLSR